MLRIGETANSSDRAIAISNCEKLKGVMVPDSYRFLLSDFCSVPLCFNRAL
jgi:hypothetical protein